MGYPSGLKGEAIPLIGRIVHVADSFDTMTTTRAYKTAVSPVKAFEELQNCAGTQFDPVLVDVFYQAYKKGKITKREYTGFDFSRLH